MPKRQSFWIWFVSFSNSSGVFVMRACAPNFRTSDWNPTGQSRLPRKTVYSHVWSNLCHFRTHLVGLYGEHIGQFSEQFIQKQNTDEQIYSTVRHGDDNSLQTIDRGLKSGFVTCQLAHRLRRWPNVSCFMCYSFEWHKQQGTFCESF